MMSVPSPPPDRAAGQFDPEQALASRQRQPARIEVFVSHATKDEAHVALVRQQMEALGISVYLAEHDPHGLFKVNAVEP